MRRSKSSLVLLLVSNVCVMRILMYVIGLAQFLGANPGPAIKDCWYYDHASNSIHAITGIPQPRGGGALIYSPQRHMLIFTAGAGTSAAPC